MCAGEDPTVMSFKIIDFGHARLLGDKPGASLPGSPQMEKWYRRCRKHNHNSKFHPEREAYRAVLGYYCIIL